MKQESQSAESDGEVEEIPPLPDKRHRLSGPSDERVDSPVDRYGDRTYMDDSYASTCILDDPPGPSAGMPQTGNYDQLFFQSLDEDIKKLAPHRRRRLKEVFLQTLNNLLDQQEMEMERNSVSRVCQRSQN